jgi:hypothetical protein
LVNIVFKKKILRWPEDKTHMKYIGKMIKMMKPPIRREWKEVFLFPFFSVLLAYIHCMGGDLWQFWIILHCTLVRLPSPSPIPTTLSPSHLKQLQ